MRSSRGFVMIIVLLVVVALVAAVVGMQSVVLGQKQTRIRDFDQVRARAVADHCQLRGRMYVDQIRRDTLPDDFDRVLDPNLDSHSGSFEDDFVPGSTYGGVIAYLPIAESAETGLRKALHRYRYVEMDGGGCFVRFDDNSDDVRAGQGSDIAGIEGLGAAGGDVPYRDRDIGIFISSIGVYPVAAGASASDAYARAHARTSLRVFVNTGGAPGVVAHDDLVVQSNVAICGQGGFQGDNLSYAGGGTPASVCACGDTATVAGAAQPSDCVYGTGVGLPCDTSIPCQPGATANLATPPNPDVIVPTPVHWLELDGFQDPKNPKSLGENGVCEFYFRSDNVKKTWSAVNNNLPNDVEAGFMNGTTERGEIFVWDHTDNDAQACSQPNTRLAVCPTAKIVTHNCQTDADTTYLVGARKVVKRPCRWLNGDSGAIATNSDGPIVECTNPNEQTPCWKLTARLTEASSFSGRAVVQQDHRVTGDTCTPACGGTTPICSKGTCVALVDIKEDTAPTPGGDEGFNPSPTQRVPNIEKYWGDPTVNGFAPGTAGSQNDGTAAVNVANYWEDLCGPCPNCTGIDGWKIQSNEHFHFEKSPMCGNNFFNPAIMVFENQNDSLAVDNETGRFHVRADWGNGCAVTPRVTVIAQATADIDKNTRICGAWSDCSVFPAPCDRSSAGKSNGYVLRAGGECYIGDGAVFIGDMQCGVIHVNNTATAAAADCIIGDLVAFNDASAHPKASDKADPTTGVCPAATAYTGFVDDCSRGFCANNAFKMVGDIISDGDICIKQGATVFGSVLGGGDGTGNIYIESNVTINGQLVSEGDIGIKTNTTINNNGTGTFGARVVSGIQSESAY